MISLPAMVFRLSPNPVLAEGQPPNLQGRVGIGSFCLPVERFRSPRSGSDRICTAREFAVWCRTRRPEGLLSDDCLSTNRERPSAGSAIQPGVAGGGLVAGCAGTELERARKSMAGELGAGWGPGLP